MVESDVNMNQLDAELAVQMKVVIEDCIDQLAILGRIMPVPLDKKNRNQENTLPELEKLKKSFEKAKAAEKMEREDERPLHDSMKNGPIMADIMIKIQRDRSELEKIMELTKREIEQFGTFEVLSEKVEKEKSFMDGIEDTMNSEEEFKKEIKSLQRQSTDLKKEQEVEIRKRNERIEHLKDQVQETRAKVCMEEKYYKKVLEVEKEMHNLKCDMAEREINDEIKKYNRMIDDEDRVTEEIKSYLRTHQIELEKQVDVWMEKYEKDTEDKQQELEELRANRKDDQERMEETTRQYFECDQVVLENRIAKEKVRRRMQYEADSYSSAVKLQAWWRGVMVRRGIGNFKRKKKKPGKKGKKGNKGKKGRK